MSEKLDNILENIAETIAQNVPKQKSVSSFFEEQTSSSVNTRLRRLFGRQKPVYHLLGGGKSADVLLWRNKKISASTLSGATAIWVLFEWLNYHFLTLLFVALVLGMLIQFLWLNVSGLFNRSPSKVPRLVLPSELFVNIGVSVGNLVNQALRFLQDVSCGGNLKQFLVVVASLWFAALIGSWFNFLTVLYAGFVAAHTLPVLYEKYEDQVDSSVYNVFGQFQNQYQKLDAGFLSKIPKGKLSGKKLD
ncbi:reticulon-like protein B8 [Mangifera indica]|uniref:reticulon-like protein B8 n=1 Tax=Mangifera indica TaxID=29780 RepID=UPI001CFC3482|nr:reticulon-like protein B8 [Mangifera indica]XP_044501794.1 reticulon-like protein B8 [Mangifera indica]